MINRAIICLILLIGFVSPAFGIGILPSDREGGELDLDTIYNFSFTLTNTHPYDLNITFETVNNNLKSYITYNPSTLILNTTDNRIPFEVIINPKNIPHGNYILIFKPNAISYKPELNYNENTSVAGIIVPTSTGTISFNVPEEPEIPDDLPDPESPSGGLIGEMPVISKIKLLEIEVPLFVKLTEESVLVIIKLKNTGTLNLRNLSIILTPDNQVSLKYNQTVGNLSVSEEKNILVELSNTTAIRTGIKINVYDSTDNWSALFMVYTETSRSIVETGCIEIEPKKFTIEADKNISLNLTLINICNTTLNNVAIEIAELNYTKNLLTIEDHATIKLNLTLGKGEYHYKIKSAYDGGYSTSAITIYVRDYPHFLDEIKKLEQMLEEIKNKLILLPFVPNRENLTSETNEIEYLIEYTKELLNQDKTQNLQVLLTQIRKNGEIILNHLNLWLILNLLAILLLFSMPLIIWSLIKLLGKKELEKEIRDYSKKVQKKYTQELRKKIKLRIKNRKGKKESAKLEKVKRKKENDVKTKQKIKKLGKTKKIGKEKKKLKKENVKIKQNGRKLKKENIRIKQKNRKSGKLKKGKRKISIKRKKYAKK